MAELVPAEIRKVILERKMIDKAKPYQENELFKFLFEAYAEFIDVAKEVSDFTCHQCRGKVWEDWKKLKPYLITLEATGK